MVNHVEFHPSPVLQWRMEMDLHSRFHRPRYCVPYSTVLCDVQTEQEQGKAGTKQRHRDEA